MERKLNILILSPHRDDAAFSLSLAIQSWLTAGHNLTLMNVFTRSLYAPFSDAGFVHENDRLSYVSAMRLREDELFLQRMTEGLPRIRKGQLHMVDLNLKDAPIRLRTPVDRLCETPINPEDPAIEKIRKALARQSEAGHMQALALPLALGNHVDHLTVREAALPMTPAMPSAFYEDLPYVTRPTATTDLDHTLAITSRIGEPLTPVLAQTSAPMEQAIARKRHLALGYASQIDKEAAELIAAYAASYNGAERLWANQPWLAAFASTA